MSASSLHRESIYSLISLYPDMQQWSLVLANDQLCTIKRKPSIRGQPLNKEQMARPQYIHCLEVLL